VLGNDTDVDSGTLTAAVLAGASNGTVTLNTDGSFSYVPNPSFSGTDTFTYTASDGTLQSNVATVSIVVTPGNQAPVAANDTYTTNEDVALNVSAPGVLGNDTDENGDALTAAVVAGPSNGTLTLNANGSFIYTPNGNFNGSDSFTYRASDASLQSNIATVAITITAVNDDPTAVNDSKSVMQDSVAAAIAVLANDSSVEAGETLTISAVTQGAHGSVAITGEGTDLTYAPAAGYSGADSFTYTIGDGNGGSATATVAITVVAKPSITINNVSVVEGNSGTTNAIFDVTLSNASLVPVTVNYATVNGFARAGTDYIATSGTLSFAAGDTLRTVTVKVIGETTKEKNETFAVRLSAATNATIARTDGIGTILDDDSTPTTTTSSTSTKEGDSTTSSSMTMTP
jgi:VCBS repeat-containing protein